MSHSSLVHWKLSVGGKGRMSMYFIAERLVRRITAVTDRTRWRIFRTDSILQREYVLSLVS